MFWVFFYFNFFTWAINWIILTKMLRGVSLGTTLREPFGKSAVTILRRRLWRKRDNVRCYIHIRIVYKTQTVCIYLFISVRGLSSQTMVCLCLALVLSECILSVCATGINSRYFCKSVWLCRIVCPTSVWLCCSHTWSWWCKPRAAGTETPVLHETFWDLCSKQKDTKMLRQQELMK